MLSLGGHDKVRTRLGGCLTLLVAILSFLFAALKLQHLVVKKNPSVSVLLEENALDSSVKHSTSDSGFQMAVGLTNWVEGTKNDKRYFKWFMNVNRESPEGNDFSIKYPLHLCTDEDYSRFYPTDTTATEKVV